MKYVVVTGGVISGVGKGIIASSTGVLLKSLGLHVTAIKIDPYLNIDAGTLTPFDHGEVFVLNDGGEVDLDLGNYERFLGVTLTAENNITTGKVYQQVIARERRGDYLGKTVQVVPHLTNAIQDWIERVAKLPVDASKETPDVCIVELGGTIGDIESAPFVEALRQFQFRVGHDNFFLIHVSLIPLVGTEQKSKPTQHSVIALRGLGLSPDVIACRSTSPLEPNVAEKLAMFCHVAPKHIHAVHDCSSVYHVPILLAEQGLLEHLQRRLNFPERTASSYLDDWRLFAHKHELPAPQVKIAVVGKYTQLPDAYLSLVKAIEHAAANCGRKAKIVWIESSALEDKESSVWTDLRSCDGVLVPGGFGVRGTEGKILACNYACVDDLSFLGICLGLQLAVVEFARNVLGLTRANSVELDENAEPLVIAMPEISQTHLGGAMRLGLRPTTFVAECQAKRLYGNLGVVYERHRHRYEVNPQYVKALEEKGLQFVGHGDEGTRMEIAELKGHPFYVACQFHPELPSRPLAPSPLFTGLIEAAAIRNK